MDTIPHSVDPGEQELLDMIGYILDDPKKSRLAESSWPSFFTKEQLTSGVRNDHLVITRRRDGRKFLVKGRRLKDTVGMNFPSNHLAEATLSMEMAHRMNVGPKPLGVYVIPPEGDPFYMPALLPGTRILTITEFRPGISYEKILKRHEHRGMATKGHRRKIQKLVRFLARIHQDESRLPTDERVRKDLYENSFRRIMRYYDWHIPHQERHPFLNDTVIDRLTLGMYKEIRRWINRPDRLATTLGDCWAPNLFFGNDGSVFAIDPSRIPFADPAFDVAWFVGEYLWAYHESHRSIFRELADLFIESYIRETGDKELPSAMPLGIGLKGVVKLNQEFSEPDKVRRAEFFFQNTLEILEQGTFHWL